MSLKKYLFDLFVRVPVLGTSLRRYRLRRNHPAEWALIHNQHDTTNRHPSILHFSVNKSATQYVKDLLSRVGAENGMTPVHLHGYAFNSEFPFLDHLNADEMTKYAYVFKPLGYVYSVFGGAIEGIPAFEKYRTVLIVRDPRDVLTSMYYSTGYSHAVPESGSDKQSSFLSRRGHAREVDIDQFVLESAEAKRKVYQRYIDLLIGKHPEIHVTRYEDMTGDFENWLDNLLAYCQLEVSPSLQSTLQQEASKIRPAQENIHAHVRQARPGDHRRKLKPDTIDALNVTFKDVLQTFNYLYGEQA